MWRSWNKDNVVTSYPLNINVSELWYISAPDRRWIDDKMYGVKIIIKVKKINDVVHQIPRYHFHDRRCYCCEDLYNGL